MPPSPPPSAPPPAAPPPITVSYDGYTNNRKCSGDYVEVNGDSASGSACMEECTSYAVEQVSQTLMGSQPTAYSSWERPTVTDAVAPSPRSLIRGRDSLPAPPSAAPSATGGTTRSAACIPRPLPLLSATSSGRPRSGPLLEGQRRPRPSPPSEKTSSHAAVIRPFGDVRVAPINEWRPSFVTVFVGCLIDV